MHGNFNFFETIAFVLIMFPMLMPLAAAPFVYIGMFMVGKWTFKGLRALYRKVRK